MELLVCEPPSTVSSIYTKEDIKIFDKYRNNYKKFFNFVRQIVEKESRTAIDINKLSYRKTGNLLIDDKTLINIFEDDYTFFMNEDDEYFDMSVIKLLWGRTSTNYYTVNEFSVDLITAFYIQEDVEWFELYCKNTSKSSKIQGRYQDEILIARYEKESYNFEDVFRGDDGLENLLERVKSFPFLDDYLSFETLLENSKKEGVLIPSECGKEEIEIKGKKYKRVVLVHPALPINGKCLFYINFPFVSKGRYYKECVTLSPHHYENMLGLSEERYCLRELGNKKQGLITFNNKKFEIIL